MAREKIEKVKTNLNLEHKEIRESKQEIHMGGQSHPGNASCDHWKLVLN